MPNIILIGMPGSGKSTIGVLLAKELGYEFIDTDLLIQRLHQAKLAEIIEKEGNEGFLRIENEVCRSLKADYAVIATGGSAVYSPEAMAHLKKLGRIIYLHVELEKLKKRLQDIKARGVVLPQGMALEDIYRERKVLYERYADLTIAEENDTLEESVARVLEAMC
ncbi:MAG: shikimate kinase [Blautia sp.]|nr:shikimate kinase [Blautia sp.]MBR6350433.1 shikimate kinase [Lachnospiraceae bacterium]